MIGAQERVTTGLKGLDTILDGLRLGDNVVWHLDELADYRQFVEPFVRSALEDVGWSTCASASMTRWSPATCR